MNLFGFLHNSDELTLFKLSLIILIALGLQLIIIPAMDYPLNCFRNTDSIWITYKYGHNLIFKLFWSIRITPVFSDNRGHEPY